MPHQLINQYPAENLQRVGVALSGGGDSMALAHALCHAPQGFEVFAFTVDHGLRPESADEAALVGARVKNWRGMHHHILRWAGDKPKTGIMAAAREARYALLAEACQQQGIKYLAIAHHADDQAETFFMRLSHGSGLDGLCGMQTITPYNDALMLWRPLLHVGHEALLDYCRQAGIAWVEDPSNQNQHYMRPRLRAALKAEGLDAARLATTLRRLKSASDTLKNMAASLYNEALIAGEARALSFSLSILAAAQPELALRVLRTAIDTLGTQSYGPRLEKLEDMLPEILATKRKRSFTLGGCLITVAPRADSVHICPQEKVL